MTLIVYNGMEFSEILTCLVSTKESSNFATISSLSVLTVFSSSNKEPLLVRRLCIDDADELLR